MPVLFFTNKIGLSNINAVTYMCSLIKIKKSIILSRFKIVYVLKYVESNFRKIRG